MFLQKTHALFAIRVSLFPAVECGIFLPRRIGSAPDEKFADPGAHHNVTQQVQEVATYGPVFLEVT
jgi:hypothetical protein